jgi:hypothetical protein
MELFMRKLIEIELPELHRAIRNAFVSRYEQTNSKLDNDSKKPIPSEKWTMLVTQGLVDRDLVMLDELFNCSADWNRMSKLALLDVVKSEGFDIDMKTTGKNMMAVICEQIEIDNALLNSLKKSMRIDGPLDDAKEDIAHFAIDGGEPGGAATFINKLITENGFTEIVKVGNKSYLGSTIQNTGYLLHNGLKKFASLSVDKFTAEIEVARLQGPGHPIIWGENKVEDGSMDLLMRM